MATFQVPQFIETKPKIVGFLSLGQFLYVAAGGILCFAFYFVFTLPVWVLFSIVVMGMAFALAFLKINGRSFPEVMKNAFSFAWNPRRYIWEREIPKATLDTSHIEKLTAMRQRMKVEEKIKSVALGITTGKLFSVDQFRKSGSEDGKKNHYQVVTYLTGERKLAKRIDY